MHLMQVLETSHLFLVTDVQMVKQRIIVTGVKISVWRGLETFSARKVTLGRKLKVKMITDEHIGRLREEWPEEVQQLLATRTVKLRVVA